MMSKRKFMLYLSVLVVLFLFSLLIGYIFYPKPKTKDINITNITGNGVTISWLTDDPTKESIVVSKNEIGFKEVLSQERFYDDRDTDYDEENEIIVDAQKRQTHHVTIFGLLPETEYHFAIANRYKSADVEISKFTTAKIDEELFAPDPVYASVLNEDMSIDPPKDGIVYYQLYNTGEFQVTSQIYSTTLNENASWAGDIAGIKTISDDKFILSDSTIITVDIKTSDGNGQESYQLVDYKPLPILYIKSNTDTSSNTNVFVNKVMADEDCGVDACEAGGGICYPTGFIAENTSTSTGDPIGTYVCGDGTWKQISSEIRPREQLVDSMCKERINMKCEETYKETCYENGKVGTKTCHKIGESICGITGSSCPWGSGSGCSACDVSSDVEPIRVTNEGRKLLEQYPGQESKSATTPVPSGAQSSGGVTGNACVFSKDNYTIEFEVNDTIKIIGPFCYINDQLILEIQDVDDEILKVKFQEDIIKYKYENFDWISVTSTSNDSQSSDVVAPISDTTICTEANHDNCICPVVSNYENSGMVMGYEYCNNDQHYKVAWENDECLSKIVDSSDKTCKDVEDFGQPISDAQIDIQNNDIPDCKEGSSPYTCNCANSKNLTGKMYGSHYCLNGDKYKISIINKSNVCEGTLVSSQDSGCQSKRNYEAPESAAGYVFENQKYINSVYAQSTSNLEVTDSGYYQTYIGDDFENPIAEFAVNLDGADKAKVTLFIDSNSNGILDTGETTLSDYSQIKLKKETEVAKYNLVSGWNLIALPLISNEGVKTANDLIENFNKQGANVKHISKYTQSGFVIYTRREGDTTFANNFSLVPGQGYFVLNYTPKEVILKGNKFDQSIPISIQNGWNLIGVYTNERPYTGSNLLKDLASDGITADTVSKYQTGRYTNLVLEDNVVYGNDYIILERQGYFLRVKEGGGENIKFTPLPDNAD